ncbi:MAG TPA: 2-oxo-4-hydroxy-4-carboxy-5-ureidoimidazoline decarboxylase [Hellea balneolensis]|uniref:2-oxo-4-hydroxy-4-carboxy-5-ureidoimidazoline decarboxylase n=1 Tax=Hellea balneolensis TaxID=287478 RepID=A0A7C5R4H3_9PROT|nr:2-oxo-4-hydroxy-4-carboxy-5-ureidoimidazoline decarboxylase [Hellea balneolensis]
MDKAEFVDKFGGCYEHTPWAAFRAWRPDLSTCDQITRAMKTVVEQASPDEQDALICAHPDLAGKLALAGGLSASSTREQAGAGLDACTEVELEKFQRLNAAYKAKFGFPFIIAVKGLERSDILAAFARRLENDKDEERRTALAQIHKIAAFRIRDICHG